MRADIIDFRSRLYVYRRAVIDNSAISETEDIMKFDYPVRSSDRCSLGLLQDRVAMFTLLLQVL